MVIGKYIRDIFACQIFPSKYSVGETRQPNILSNSIKMYPYKDIREHLEHITQEVIEAKRAIIALNIRNKEKTKNAWKDLMQTSPEISKLWAGQSAVEEIRNQRTKAW